MYSATKNKLFNFTVITHPVLPYPPPPPGLPCGNLSPLPPPPPPPPKFAEVNCLEGLLYDSP